jgi:hypothetical protein
MTIEDLATGGDLPENTTTEKVAIETVTDEVADQNEAGDKTETDKVEGEKVETEEEKTAKAESIARKKAKTAERIAELNTKYREEQRRADALQKKVDALEEIKKPDPSKFEDVDDFEIERAKHAAAQVRKVEVQGDQTTAQEAAHAASLALYAERVEALLETIPDFDGGKKLSDLIVNQPGAQQMANIILNEEDGPLIAHHLTENPKEATRIARLTGAQQAIEMGRISARLSAKALPKITTAPEPLKTVGGRSSAASPDPEKMSFAQFKAFREKGNKT